MGTTNGSIKGFTNFTDYQRELPAPQPRLAVTSDTITPTHTITFCTPVPVESYTLDALNPPGTKDCGIFTKFLEDFPSNDLPSGGVGPTIRISPSEMAFSLLRLDNYPSAGGTASFKWVRVRDNKILYTRDYTVDPPNPSWTFWYWQSWSFIGHFDWEIIEPGDYYVEWTTTWGNAKIDFTIKTSPFIFNTCWGSSLPEKCAIPPDQPVVTVGSTVNIKADISNISGVNRRIQVIFKDGTTTIGTAQEIASLAPLSTGGLWSPTVSLTMPNRNVPLTIESYGWDGKAWDKADVKTSTISSVTPTCTGIAINASTVIAKIGDIITLFAAGITPATQVYTVTFTDRSNTVLGTCTSSNGACTISWNTTGLSAGQYFVKASVPNQCISTELAIALSVPIRQWGVKITVINSNTSIPISGATVTIGTQTPKTTDVNGVVNFTVDEGQIYIAISKTGYNPLSDTQLVFNTKTLTYLLVPVTPTTGTLQFVIVTLGSTPIADVSVDGMPRGSTDSNGIITIPNLTPVSHNYTITKVGFNTINSSVSISGGMTTQILLTMAPSTQTTGDLNIASTPAGAQIFRDDVLQLGMTTPKLVTGLTPGPHTYKLTLSGYQDVSKPFNITAGQTTVVDVTLNVLSTIGTLDISSTPPGARIFVDNIDTTHITPSVISGINAGPHTYKLTLSGYQDISKPFNITAGQTAQIAETLIAIISTTGNLEINSIPPGAFIFVDDVYTKKITPATITGLTPVTHTYRLELTGFPPKSGTFKITIGQTIPISVSLTIIPGISNTILLLGALGFGILALGLLGGGSTRIIEVPSRTIPSTSTTG